MTTIEIKELGDRIAGLLKQQHEDEPMLVTKDSQAIAMIIRLPRELREADVDVAVWLDTPFGPSLIVLEAKSQTPEEPEASWGRPTYGRCKDMLTIVSEDTDHLTDFREYMQ